MQRNHRLTRRQQNPELSARFPLDSQFLNAVRRQRDHAVIDRNRQYYQRGRGGSRGQSVRGGSRPQRGQGGLRARRNQIIQIHIPPNYGEDRDDAPDVGLPVDSIRTYRNTVNVNTIEELESIIQKPNNDPKNCFKQNLLILSPSIYGELLCKPALRNPLVQRHMSFFLGLYFHKINNDNEISGFDPNGNYVIQARNDFSDDNFHELFESFTHRLIKRQNFIQIVKINDEFPEEKWLKNVGTIIHNLQTLDNYEKKNLMKFMQLELPSHEQVQLESTESPITSSQNIMIDEFLSPVKKALCHKIICFSCCQGFKSDLVSKIIFFTGSLN